jgi:16S rRNA G966 N2-methylase RsmD
MIIKYEILFPELTNRDLYKCLQIDDDSVHLISTRIQSRSILDLILKFLKSHHLHSKKLVLTDMTAGVGGNTIMFGKYFEKVNAIEIDKLRYNYLKNNCNVYNLNNICFFNNNSLDIIQNLESDIIFIDPPWNTCKLSNMNMKEMIEFLFEKQKNKLKIIVIKLPLDYSIGQIPNVELKYIYLKKMLIILAKNNLYSENTN